MRGLIAPGLLAVRANLAPFLLIQGLAVALVITYYSVPAFASGAGTVAEAKGRGGFLASGLLTMLASVVLSEGAKRATRAAPTDPGLLRFQIVFFFFIGIWVDLVYRVLTVLFGAGTDLGTVLRKMLFDQFVWTPILAVPYSVALFLWAERGYRVSAVRTALRDGTFRERCEGMLGMCWVFWIPILLCVFALPVPLQFLMFLVAQGAWALLVVHASHRPAR